LTARLTIETKEKKRIRRTKNKKKKKKEEKEEGEGRTKTEKPVFYRGGRAYNSKTRGDRGRVHQVGALKN